MLGEESSYVVKDTSDRNEDEFADHKPDLTMFHKELGRSAWEVDCPAKHAQESWDKARVCFAWSICLMEVKTTAREDLFVEEDGKTVFSTSNSGKRTREQIFRYVIELFLRQHREFAFIVLIVGQNARLTVWDRTGVITTEPFNYVHNVHPLLNFVYRLAKADRAGQGFDTTVRPAEPQQIEELKAFKETRTNPYEREFIEEMLENPHLYPIQQVCTPAQYHVHSDS